MSYEKVDFSDEDIRNCSLDLEESTLFDRATYPTSQKKMYIPKGSFPFKLMPMAVPHTFCDPCGCCLRNCEDYRKRVGMPEEEENCTSLINHLIKASGHDTHFLTPMKGKLFYVTIVVAAILGGYNIGDLIFVYELNQIRQDEIDNVVSILAITLLSIQSFLILFNPFFRFIFSKDLRKIEVHIGLLVAQFLLSGLSWFLENTLPNTKNLYLIKQENFSYIGAGLGAMIGFIHWFFPAAQFLFYTVYRPEILKQFMDEESTKNPRSQYRYIEKKELLQMLSWLQKNPDSETSLSDIPYIAVLNSQEIDSETQINEQIMDPSIKRDCFSAVYSTVSFFFRGNARTRGTVPNCENDIGNNINEPLLNRESGYEMAGKNLLSELADACPQPRYV